MCDITLNQNLDSINTKKRQILQKGKVAYNNLMNI